MKFSNNLACLLLVFISIIPFVEENNIFAQKHKFTVVIDAGHGGHDPGAKGSFSYEKNINLDISLKLARLIQKNCDDVKVVLTRKTDVFLELQERADIVNDNHADLFICIHTNATKGSSAYGAETYTLGLAKTKANLDVAMRENSVILLEDNYKAKYKDFDPNSVDSYIMFEFMQDKYIDKSIDFASTVQKQFGHYAKRYDRGVRQAGFWVLHRSACPSVLVEVGFISNPTEEKYLNSESGQTEIAQSIYNAFVDFKKEFDKRSGKRGTSSTVSKEPEVKKEDNNIKEQAGKEEQKDTTPAPKNDKVAGENIVDSVLGSKKETTNVAVTNQNAVPVFKVQIFAVDHKLKSTDTLLRSLDNVDYFEENGFFKYTVGSETDYNKILEIRKDIASKFKDAFIIAFVGDKKISAKEALKLIK
ncbi:MAG: N-acetylmuramoyl-L-alanine amidase [Paludibacter sp.]|nr:N-acetylmuramoyl-L-alanine amidase [Paludibacter sp.]